MIRAYHNAHTVTIYVGPYVTAFAWSRTGTFGVRTRPDGTVRFGRFRFWLARWWSGISRWEDDLVGY